MKIVVANESEKKLLEKLIEEFHECDIADEIHKITFDCDPLHCFTEDEATIINYAFDQCKVVIDEKEKDILLEEDDMITGTCKFCGVQTTGMSDDCYDAISYEDYLKLMSPEEQEKWTCYECYRRLCSCCGEKLTENDDTNLCPDCEKEESRTQAGD